MKFHAVQAAIALLLLASPQLPLRAGDANVRSPILGYMLDSRVGTIRAITGVPGSASLGEAVSGETGLRRAAISPSLNYAIAEQENSPSLVLIRWAGRRTDTLPLEGAPSDSTLFVLSPLGTAAAVIVPASEDSGTTIRVFKGLPQSVQVAFDVETTGEAAALAVSDDGSLAAVSDRSSVTIHESNTAGRRVFEGEAPAVAFRPGSVELAIVSAASRTVTLLSSGGAQRSIGNDSLESPYALAFSGDGRRLVVAQEPGAITLIEEGTGEEATVQCDFRADGFYMLQGHTVFRLADSAKGAIAVLDGDHGEPRIVSIAAFESSPGEK